MLSASNSPCKSKAQLGGASGSLTPKVWRLYPEFVAPMRLQMALDEVLFNRLMRESDVQQTSFPLLRFYRASEPAVTVGYSFRPSSSQGEPNVDENARRQERADRQVIRRMTGGGRVEHGRDFLFSLFARKRDDESFHSVRLSYLKIHEAVKMALEACGCVVSFYRCDQNLPKGHDCFRFPIATDLAVDGRKVAGGGQKRSLGCLLHQETVHLPQGTSETCFAAELKRGFGRLFNVDLFDGAMNPEDVIEAETLADFKYVPLEREETRA